MIIRQPRPVRAWEKELPAWVRNFEGEQAEEANAAARDDKTMDESRVKSWGEFQRLPSPGAAWRLSP